MSKKAYFFLFGIVISFGVMISYTVYESYAEYVAKQNAAAPDNRNMFYSAATEENTPPPQSHTASLSFSSEEVSAVSVSNDSVPVNISTPAPVSAEITNIIEEAEKNKEAVVQAVRTNKELKNNAKTVLDKYMAVPVVAQFNADLQAAGVNTDFSSLAGGDFAQMMQQNPQLQSVLIKYSQNPEFVKALQQMMADPEVQKLAAQAKAAASAR
ncbi:hypothetical protein Dip518_001094 [Parelusimicrobium proximum]|uniref:hypothetical protein n=1 Tax=Parelusimicrobium proximum TaxID=3228953 RepID=UPI003D16DA20